MVRIERGFHVAKRVVELRTKKLLVQVTARQAVAMLAAHSATELDNEVCDLIGHVLHDLNVPRVFCIDERTYMQTPDAGVAIVTGAGFVLVNDFPEFQKEFGQL